MSGNRIRFTVPGIFLIAGFIRIDVDPLRIDAGPLRETRKMLLLK